MRVNEYLAPFGDTTAALSVPLDCGHDDEERVVSIGSHHIGKLMVLFQCFVNSRSWRRGGGQAFFVSGGDPAKQIESSDMGVSLNGVAIVILLAVIPTARSIQYGGTNEIYGRCPVGYSLSLPNEQGHRSSIQIIDPGISDKLAEIFVMEAIVDFTPLGGVSG